MRRRAGKAAPLAALALCAALSLALPGCRNHPAYDEAVYFERHRDYVSAVEAIQEAVKDKPKKEKYLTKRQELRRMVVEQLLKCAQQEMQKDENLLAAWSYAKRVLDFDPENEASLRLLAKIEKTMGDTLSTLETARKELDAGRFEDAREHLLEIRNKRRTYPRIEQAYQACIRLCAEVCMREGIGQFEHFDFRDATRHLEKAVARLPANSDMGAWDPRVRTIAQAWQDFARGWGKKAVDWRTAETKCDAADALAYAAPDPAKPDAARRTDREKYQAAYRLYCDAVALAPEYLRARTGRDRALLDWTREIHMDARKLESRTLKPFLYQSLDQYALCLRNIPGFLDTEARMKAVNRRLAGMFIQEGDYYARLPNLRRIGLAYDCYKRALKHDPGIERLAKTLPQIEKLFALKRRVGVRVDVAGEGDFPKRVSAELAAAIRQKGYPDVDVGLGRVDTLHGQYDQSVRSIGADLGLELNDLDVPYTILQIEGQVLRDFASKTGADQPIPITSSYVSHAQAVDNPEHLEALVQSDLWSHASGNASAEAAALSRDVARVRGVRDQRAREHGATVAALTNKQKEQANLYNAARAHASQASSLDAEAASAGRKAGMAAAQGNGSLAAQYQARARQYAAQANNERRAAAGLNASGNALQPAINQLKGVENAARQALNRAENHFRAASAALAGAVARRAAAAKDASLWGSRVKTTSRQIRKDIATSYGFKRHMIQVFGRVKATLRVVAEKGQAVMARPACDKSDLKDQVVDTDVKGTDINGNDNGTDKLISAETMQEQLRRQAIAELASQLHDFFVQGHRDRFYAAARQHLKDGREIAAGEAYAAFLACESNSPEAKEARAFLDKLAQQHLK